MMCVILLDVEGTRRWVPGSMEVGGKEEKARYIGWYRGREGLDPGSRWSWENMFLGVLIQSMVVIVA